MAQIDEVVKVVEDLRGQIGCLFWIGAVSVGLLYAMVVYDKCARGDDGRKQSKSASAVSVVPDANRSHGPEGTLR